MVNFTLRSTTNEMISISTSQTFRSWVVIFHLRQPMEFFISQLIQYSRACSSYECFILWARWLSSKLLKQGYLAEHLKSSFRKFYGRYGDLIQQYEVSLSRMLNDILILDQRWLPNPSDFPPISWPWYRAWPSPIMSGFHEAFANGCDMPAGNAYPSGHLVPSPILGLANAPIVETKFLELAMSLLDFSPRIPLGTFSILLMLQLLRPVFPNLPLSFPTFHLEYPSLLSRFCFILIDKPNFVPLSSILDILAWKFT